MQQQSSEPGETIWIVDVEWPRGTQLIVGPDTQAGAEQSALARVKGHEATAWARVGDPVIVGSRPATVEEIGDIELVDDHETAGAMA